jgi:hypothetical protein
MKYLKNFTEMITESVMYTKKEILDLILIEMNAEMYGEEEFRKDLEKLSPNKFEELANQYGYKEFSSGYWVPDYSKKKTEYGKKKIEYPKMRLE